MLLHLNHTGLMWAAAPLALASLCFWNGTQLPIVAPPLITGPIFPYSYERTNFFRGNSPSVHRSHFFLPWQRG